VSDYRLFPALKEILWATVLKMLLIAPTVSETTWKSSAVIVPLHFSSS
jgi:hypothetical protein